jgi:osmotically-inducible protein OsmY
LKPLPTPAPVADDKMIEGTVNENLKKASITGITVTVANGVVTLKGDIAKDKLASVMQAASAAKPAKIDNQLNIK